MAAIETGWMRRALRLLALPQGELARFVLAQVEGNPWLEEVPPAGGAGEDIVVTEEAGALAVALGRGGLPGVRLWPPSVAAGPDAAGRKLREEAQRLAHALEWREGVLLAVAKEVAEGQADFLTGRGDLPRRLRLREIAGRLNVHESTVGRVTRNKTVLTPRGRFSLRFLVNARTNPEILQEAIRALIAGEDPARPLSDPQIAERLAAAGLKVARRTVSKHRQATGLPERRDRRR